MLLTDIVLDMDDEDIQTFKNWNGYLLLPPGATRVPRFLLQTLSDAKTYWSAAIAH